MTALAWLIPAALFLGLLGVLAFFWALRSGQFEDLDGAAYRILEDDPPPPAPSDPADDTGPAAPAPKHAERASRDHTS